MGLKVWFPLDGDLKNLGASNINVTLNSNNTWVTGGKIGSASLKLTKLQTILPESSCMSGCKQMSFAYWVKANTAWSTNWLDGIRWYSTNGTENYSSRQEFYTNCTLIGVWYKGGSISGKPFTVGTWTHVAATFDYSTGKAAFYINGILQGTATTLDTTHYCRGDFHIGDANVDIVENDVRIYDHCLSAAEVHEIAQGLVLHYKLDGPLTGISENLLLNTNAYKGTTFWANWGTAGSRQIIEKYNKKWFSFVANGGETKYGGFAQDSYNHTNYNDAIIKPNTTYTVSALAFASANTKMRFWLHQRSSEGGANIIQNTYDFIATTEPSRFTYTFTTGTNANYTINRLCLMLGAAYEPSTDHICYFTEVKIEENNKATPWILANEEMGIDNTKIIDSSGYNHNGTILNAVSTTTDTARYNMSTNLIAGDSAINCGRGGMVTDSITVNLWIKTSNWANPVSCTEGGGWNFEATGNGFRFPIYISGVGYKYGASTTTRAEICNNNWHMLTGVYDRINQKLKIYVDGNLDNSIDTETSNPIAYHGTNVIWLGGEATGSNTTASNGMAGLFSDFRIYCTALSDTDIKSLYNLGMKVDNSQNLHTFEMEELSRNYIEIGENWLNKSGTTNGINWTFNSDGTITLNGTNSLSANFILIWNFYDATITSTYNGNDAIKHIPNGIYTIYTGHPKLLLQVFGSNVEGNTYTAIQAGDSTTAILTIDDTYKYNWVRLLIRSGATFNNFTFYPTIVLNENNSLNKHSFKGNFRENQKASFYKNKITEADEFIEI